MKPGEFTPFCAGLCAGLVLAALMLHAARAERYAHAVYIAFRDGAASAKRESSGHGEN